MRRYIFEEKISLNESLIIDRDLFKHIFKVCRYSVGQSFELLSFERAYLVEVVKVNKSSAEVFVKEFRDLPKLKKPYVHLVLANPRPAVFENVVEKAVELGVKGVYPITSQKSFLKNIEKLKLKENRISKIVKHAVQQSGRAEDLVLHEASEFGAFLEKFKKLSVDEKVKGWMLYEAGSAEMSSAASLGAQSITDVFLLVGGEGGFSAAEAAEATSAGFEVFVLGEQILRVETACVAGISILKSKLEIW